MNKILTAVAVTVMSVGTASAATLTLDTLSSGYFGSTVAVVNEATITSHGDDLYFYGTNFGANNDRFCAIDNSSCATDMEIDFNSVVENLSFGVHAWVQGDSVALNIYGIGDALLGSVNIVSNALVDLTSFGAITRLFFDDSSTQGGVAYEAFSFDEISISAVPLPASLPFLMVGLGALGLTRKRKKS